MSEVVKTAGHGGPLFRSFPSLFPISNRFSRISRVGYASCKSEHAISAFAAVPLEGENEIVVLCPLLPRGNREPIVLDLQGVRWHATLNSANSNNPPYVHSSFKRDDGIRFVCTDVFLKLGLAEKAQLEFELNANDFRLIRVVDNGKWRIGNEPGRRSLKVKSSSQPRFSCASVKGGNESRTVGATFPFANRQEILRLDWQLITADEVAEERAFEQKMPAARQQTWLTKPFFVRICRWKSVRQTRRYALWPRKVFQRG